LIVKHDEPFSKFAFSFNLRHYGPVKSYSSTTNYNSKYQSNGANKAG
jgi:hypothetical protein